MGPIVLEGPDCSGKTTLAKELVERLGVNYVHQGPPPKHVEDLAGFYADMLLPNTVFDRLALSEMVYGPLLRGGSKIDAAGWARFHNALAAQGGIHIICLPPVETCVAAWRANIANELIQDEKMFEFIYRQYALFALAAFADTLSIRVYDWTKDSPRELAQALYVEMNA